MIKNCLKWIGIIIYENKLLLLCSVKSKKKKEKER